MVSLVVEIFGVNKLAMRLSSSREERTDKPVTSLDSLFRLMRIRQDIKACFIRTHGKLRYLQFVKTLYTKCMSCICFSWKIPFFLDYFLLFGVSVNG